MQALQEELEQTSVELLAAGPIDTLVVQVGDGALITGIARWIKAQSPRTRVVGVGPSGWPAMALSWEAGRPVSTPRADTIAGALAVRDPVADSVARMRGLVDDFVLVDALPSIAYAGAHLPGAISIPPERLDTLAERRIPSLDTEVVVYCANPTCESSVQVAQRLGVDLSVASRQIASVTGSSCGQVMCRNRWTGPAASTDAAS